MSTIIFYDPNFPYAGSLPEELPADLFNDAEVANADTLGKALAQEDVECFVHLHGPYFPKSAWVSILNFLKKGKGFVHVGGAPFRIPVSFKEGRWQVENEQTAYHQQIQIHEALKVEASPIDHLKADEEIPVMKGMEDLFSIEDTCNLIMHPTKQKDLPQENGSGGPMDAHIYPLLKGISADEREVAAPVVLIENHRGEFAGGRWLLINQPLGKNFWNEKGISGLSKWAAFCSQGVTEIWLKPNYASYYPNERPVLNLQYQKIVNTGDALSTDFQGETWSFTIEVQNQENKDQYWSTSLEVQVERDLRSTQIPVLLDVKPGIYQIQCKAESEKGEHRVIHQGFWGFDQELLKEGEPVTCDRDYFRKNGKPYPVVGMTYMTSDVARKYLFLPNVYAWDQDMKTMAEAGVNWIRTGLWTAWRQVMFADGHASVEVLRAFDAFVLTAKKYDLELTFNFFSFTPEAWEGSNPYLDPRSVEAQKRFLLSVVHRHKETTNLNWDLINEPSLFDPSRIFSGPRPLHDTYEKSAWAAWLQERHGEIEALQNRWNMTPEELPDFQSAALPEQSEIAFHVEDIKKLKKNTRWLDYTLFTMEIHNRWAKELLETIQNAAPQQLVTVGQDEALGRGPRPSPFFYAEAVDYTTVHSWWLNDDLVWDGVFGKAPDKPNLIQETGVMYLENPNNTGKRSESEIQYMLERKYAYAFSTGSAGAVQWLWNTNYFMDNVNESNIGAVRADGTQKPETLVSYEYGSFIKGISDLFENRELEDVAVVFPYSNDFSNRRLAFDATTRAVRVLTYDLKVPVRGIGEYHLDSLDEYPPKLIIVPSPHNFSDAALNKLIEFVENTGVVMLFTGPIGLDEYWFETDRIEKELGKTHLKNVVREEILNFSGRSYPVSYGRRRIAEVSKEVVEDDLNGGSSALHSLKLGKGELVWCPLPVELNEHTDVVGALYKEMLAKADVENNLIWVNEEDSPGIYGRKVVFNKGNLFVFVSESAMDQNIVVKDPKTERTYQFTLEKERGVLFSTDQNGNLEKVYRNVSVVVK